MQSVSVPFLMVSAEESISPSSYLVETELQNFQVHAPIAIVRSEKFSRSEIQQVTIMCHVLVSPYGSTYHGEI